MTSEASRTVLRLAIPAPLRRIFDYLPPDSENELVFCPGQVLRVPFGKREVTGVLLGTGTGADYDPDTGPDRKRLELRRALRLLEPDPVMPPSLVDLCQWTAAYYQHPVGEVFSAALPRSLREGKALPRNSVRLSLRGRGLPDGALARAQRQAEAIALLQSASRPYDELRRKGITSAVLRELTKKGLIERCSDQPAVPTARLGETPPSLADEQRAAVEAVRPDAFASYLLEGVTGSGKTEVYLRLIAACLRRSRQALVLIPEIGLTPQTLARFTARFTCPIAVLHSGLAEGARLSAWQAASNGGAGIVIGTRSALFTPLARPGLIIVDEEHDSSYKQQDGLRYHARDVAVKRAQIEDIPIVLGSATPSIESLHNVRRSRYRHSTLSERRGAGELPRLKTIDLRRLPLQAGISDALLAAVRACVIDEGQQALLFLNRRGYAPTLQCHNCGWVAECDHCDARMTVHLRQRRLRCHHCAATEPLWDKCPSCGSTHLITQGLGTEQVEAYLRSVLPCPVHRVDSDAMRGRDAMEDMLTIAEGGDPCVILGTQMLTKGHHYPAVQLVGVIDADALLFSGDFRGEERMAQLITQVAGRAGRSRAGAQVLVQTHQPNHPLLTRLSASNYSELALEMLDKRLETSLPPAGHLTLVRTDARQEADAERFLEQLRQSAPRLPAGCRLIGPVPSSMPRRAGRYRWQIWCLAPDRGAGQIALQALVRSAESLRRPRDLNWFVDVDPVDIL